MSKRPLGRKVVHKAEEQEQKPKTNAIPALSVKEFYSIEDQLADAVDPVESAKNFNSISTRVLDGVCEFAEIATRSNETEEDKPKKERLFENCLLDLTLLRRLNRLVQFKNKKHRDGVLEERQKVDELYLQLQNLLYEVSHIEQEVMRCTDGRSTLEDIELVSVDQYYKEVGSSVCEPDMTKTDPHQQMLARLSWELESRKTLANRIDEIKHENEEIEKDIEAKQCLLDTLQPKLEALLEASRPVQELLGMNYEKEVEQCKLSKHLPEPLFYLYVQMMAYKEVFDDKLTVTIEGDVEQAKKTVDGGKFEGKQRDSDIDDDESENGETQGSSSAKKGRRATVSSIVDQHADDILYTHPMRLEFKIHCKDKAIVNVQFCFIPYLGVVSVKSRVELTADSPRTVASAGDLLSDETILINLLKYDTGESCPNSVGKAKLEHFNIDLSRKVDSVGRVYEWTQRLCGLYFTQHPANSDSSTIIVEKDSEYAQKKYDGGENIKLETEIATNNDRLQECNFLQTVISKIKRRILARLALQEQIAQLECLNSHHTPKEVDTWFGGKQLVILSSWKPMLWEDFAKKCGKKLQDFAQISENGWFFHAKLDRGTARLNAYIFIHSDYPNKSPAFLLSLVVRQQTYNAEECSFLRQLERSTNIDCVVETPNSIKRHILVIQMRFLMSRLDVGLEGYFGHKGDPDFDREHLFSRSVRGKDRQMPFRYASSENSFVF